MREWLRRWRARGGPFFPAVALLWLSACGSQHGDFLDPKGPVAAAQKDHFFHVATLLLVFVALPIFILIPWFAWRYRYTAKRSRYTPGWRQQAWLEWLMWGGPCVIVGLLSVSVWQSTRSLDPYRPLVSPQPALRVDVIGYDWKWLFVYPDEGVASVGEMALPVGRPITLRLTSATVMQSFFIPALGSQIYAMGGMVSRLNLQANQAGTFMGENTMYNGNGFHAERFQAVAMSPVAFEAWLAKGRESGVLLDAIALRTLASQTTSQQFSNLMHSAEGHGITVLRNRHPELLPLITHAMMEKGSAANIDLGTDSSALPPRPLQR